MVPPGTLSRRLATLRVQNNKTDPNNMRLYIMALHCVLIPVIGSSFSNNVYANYSIPLSPNAIALFRDKVIERVRLFKSIDKNLDQRSSIYCQVGDM